MAREVVSALVDDGPRNRIEFKAPLRRRGSLPGRPVVVALAGRLSVSELRVWLSLARPQGPVAACPPRPAGFGDRPHDYQTAWACAAQAASAASLVPFVEQAAGSGSVVPADGWLGHELLENKGCRHRIDFPSGHRKGASESLRRVGKASSLLKGWVLGTHHGAISHEHLGYYLDECVFRLSRLGSRSRGKLFYGLAQ